MCAVVKWLYVHEKDWVSEAEKRNKITDVAAEAFREDTLNMAAVVEARLLIDVKATCRQKVTQDTCQSCQLANSLLQDRNSQLSVR